MYIGGGLHCNSQANKNDNKQKLIHFPCRYVWHQLTDSVSQCFLLSELIGCTTWCCRTEQVEDVSLINASGVERKPCPVPRVLSPVMMASCCQGGVLLSLLLAVCVYAGNGCSVVIFVLIKWLKAQYEWMKTCVVCPLEDMKKDCRDDHVIVVSTVKRPLVDPSLFRLGSCFPDSVTQREAVFNVHFNDCGFTRLVTSCSTQTLWCSSVLCSVMPVWCLLQVTGDQLLYSSYLTYDSSAEAKVAPFTGEPVVCEYKRWAYKTNFMTDNIWWFWCVFYAGPAPTTLRCMRRSLKPLVLRLWGSTSDSWTVSAKCFPTQIFLFFLTSPQVSYDSCIMFRMQQNVFK